MLDRYVVQDDLFTRTPVDMFIEIVSYLDPVFIAKSISLINTYFHFYANRNDFWLKKFKLHFPHKYAEYEKKFKPLHQKSIQIDAYAEFIKAYNDDYQLLLPEVRAFFSIAKENNPVNWYDNGKLILHDEWLDITDRSNHDLLFWIKKNKFVRDTIYQSKKKTYLDVNQIIDTKMNDSLGRTIFYWAFFLDQGLDEVKSLIREGCQLDKPCSRSEWPIHLAVRMGRLDLVKFIINENANMLNFTNVRDETPLSIAASQGHEAIVQYFIEQAGTNLLYTTRTRRPGMNALHFAAESGHSNIVSILINAGITANIATDREHLVYLPLHFAVKSGNLDLVDKLIKLHPETIDAQDIYGQTPFLWAVAKGHLALVQYFINAYLNENANINLNATTTTTLFSDDRGKTILHWAAEHGNYLVLLELLKLGMTIETTNKKLLPIHLACQNGHLEIVKEFLKCKPELLNVSDQECNTPLIIAVKNQRFSIVEYLLSQKGIDIHAENNANQIALHYATRGKNSEIVARLLEARAMFLHDRFTQQLFFHHAVYAKNLSTIKLLLQYDPTMLYGCDRYGMTPLMIAVYDHNIDLVKYFLSLNTTETKQNMLDAKTNSNNKDIYNRTALHFAVEVENPALVSLLLESGASHTPTSRGEFPIHIAATKWRSTVFKQIIEAVPEMINITDDHGHTPLMLAVKHGSFNGVIDLFNSETRDHRVDVRAKTCGHDDPIKNGKTALHIAAENGDSKIVTVLLASGAGTSLDLSTPITKNRYFNSMDPVIKNKIIRLEEANNKKGKSQFDHAFNFYSTSFGNRQTPQESMPQVECRDRPSLKK